MPINRGFDHLGSHHIPTPNLELEGRIEPGTTLNSLKSVDPRFLKTMEVGVGGGSLTANTDHVTLTSEIRQSRNIAGMSIERTYILLGAEGGSLVFNERKGTIAIDAGVPYIDREFDPREFRADYIIGK